MGFVLEQRLKQEEPSLQEGEHREEKNCRHKFSQMSRKSEKVNVEQVFLKGKNICFGDVCVRFLQNNLLKKRISFICGKKIASLATKRNLVKRYLREGVRQLRSKIISDVDIVLVFRGRGDISFQKISTDTKSVLERANLLKKTNG